jgi:hypothetical protein
MTLFSQLFVFVGWTHHAIGLKSIPAHITARVAKTDTGFMLTIARRPEN